MAARIGENVHGCKVRIIRARTNGKICLRTFSLFGSSSFLSLTLFRIEYRNKKKVVAVTPLHRMRNPLPPREEEELSSVFLKHPSLAFLFGKSFSRGFLTLGFIWGLPRWTNFQRGGSWCMWGQGGETTSQDQKSQLLPDSAARKAGAEKRGGGEREKCVRFLPAAKSTTRLRLRRRLRLGSVSLSPPPPSSSLLLSAQLGRKDRDEGEEALQLPAPIATAAAFFLRACSCLFFPRIVLGVSVSHE